jgi:hypothetical protein
LERRFNTSLGLRVSADAKEKLTILKATLVRRGCRASEQAIVDALILNADCALLETYLPKRPRHEP